MQFDLLFKDPNEALHLSVGLKAAYRQQRANYGKRTDTSSMVFQQFTTLRKGLLIGGTIGLEWEEYFGDHFGYSLGLQYSLPYKFKPSSYTIENYVLNYEDQAGKTGEYEYVEEQEEWIVGKKLRQETFYLQDIYLHLGLKYRF